MTLRVYTYLPDSKGRRIPKLKHIKHLCAMSRTCAYSPDGLFVVVGFGGSVGKSARAGKSDGKVEIYSITDTEVKLVAYRKDAKLWISDVKFSPVDKYTVVVASHDCKIYIYSFDVMKSAGGDISGVMKLKSTFSKHNSVINHFDISADGRFMQSNCSAYELLFSDLVTGKQISKASELKVFIHI